MFWGGGGPNTIPDIIGVYDWINRDIPSHAEMESALNTLLASGLVQKQDDRFFIPREQYQDFDAFRKKNRKDRFDTARKYFEKLPDIVDIPRVVILTAEQYKDHYKEYKRAFVGKR